MAYKTIDPPYLDDLIDCFSGIEALAVGMKGVALQGFDDGASMDDRNAVCSMADMIKAKVREAEELIGDEMVHRLGQEVNT